MDHWINQYQTDLEKMYRQDRRLFLAYLHRVEFDTFLIYYLALRPTIIYSSLVTGVPSLVDVQAG